MANDRLQRVLLQWQVDDAAIKKTLDANERVRKSLDNVQGETASVELTAKRMQQALESAARSRQVDQIGKDFARAQAEGRNLEAEVQRTVARLNELGATEDEIRRVVRAFDDLSDASARAEKTIADTSQTSAAVPAPGGRSLGQSITRAGRELFMLPDVGPSTEISRGLILAGSAVDRLKASAGQLAIAGGLAAVAVVGVAVALEAFNQQLAASKRQLDAALAAQTNYYQALGAMTTAAVREEIARLQQVVPAQRQAADEARQALDSAFNQLAAQYGDAAARLATAADPRFQALTKAAEESAAALAESEHTLTRFTQGVQQNAFAANDAAAKMEQLVEAQRKAADQARQAIEAQAEYERQYQAQRLQELIGFNQERFALEREGTAQQLTARLNALNDERRALEAALPILQANAQTSQEAYQAFDEAGRRLQYLYMDFNRLSQIVAAVSQRLRDDLAAALQDVEDKYAARVAQIEADRRDKEAKALEDKNDALEEAQDKADDARLKAEEAYNRDRKRILDRYNRDYTNAVANRDALAARTAADQRDDDLKQLKDRYDEQLKTVDDNLAKQQETIEKRYQKQLDTAKDAADKAIKLAREQADAERAEKQKGYDEAKRDLDAAIANQRAIQTAAYTAQEALQTEHNARMAALNKALYDTAEAYALDAIYALKAAAAGVKYNPGVTVIPPTIPKYASGIDTVPRDTLALLHRGEMVLREPLARQARSEGLFGGGKTTANIIIQMDGKTLRAVSRREAEKSVSTLLKKAGIA